MSSYSVQNLCLLILPPTLALTSWSSDTVSKGNNELSTLYGDARSVVPTAVPESSLESAEWFERGKLLYP